MYIGGLNQKKKPAWTDGKAVFSLISYSIMVQIIRYMI